MARIAAASLALIEPSGRAAPPIPVPPPPQPPQPQIRRGALVWQGFSHAWKHHPHRLGDLANVASGDGATKKNGAVVVNARREASFLPGQDGDEGDVRTNLRALAVPGLSTWEGHWSVAMQDQIDSTPAEFARAAWSNTVKVDLSKAIEPLNSFVVVLRGLKIDLGKTGGSGYIWPTFLNVNLGNCTLNQRVIECPLTVEIERKDSPDSKNSEKNIRYNIEVHYSIFSGGNTVVRPGTIENVSVTGRDFFSGPEQRTVTRTGIDASQGVPVTAITGFQFRLRNTGTLWPQKEGRFLSQYEFRVRDQSFSGGTLTSSVAMGVRRGKDAGSIYPASFDATLSTRVVQLRTASTCADPTTRELANWVCTFSGVSGTYMKDCGTVKQWVADVFDASFPESCW